MREKYNATNEIEEGSQSFVILNSAIIARSFAELPLHALPVSQWICVPGGRLVLWFIFNLVQSCLLDV